MLRSDAMRRAHLTASAIFASLLGACSDAAPKPKGGASSDVAAETSNSAASAAATGKPAGFRAQKFRDVSLAGPAYVATRDQVLIVDIDGSTDVVTEGDGILQIEQLPTGDLLVGASSGLVRVSGRSAKTIAREVPAMAIELSAAADDDVWAMGKRAVHHFDGQSWVATPVPGLKGEPKLRDITVDVRGVAWLAAGDDGLFEWDGARWKKEAGVKGEVRDVAPSADGVFALLPTGYVELKAGTVSEVIKRSLADVTSGDIAIDGSWAVVLEDGSASRSFSIGKGGTQTWGDLVSRLGSGAIWFAADHRGRVWSASARSIAVATKDAPNTSIPLSSAVTSELIAVEIVGTGPDKLPAEIGPSVSMPIPFDQRSTDGESGIPLPSGSARQGSVTINAEPGFADGVVSNASTVVAGMAAGFRRCYNRGLLENPNMKGSLRITAKVGPNGEVLSATASTGSGLSQSVVSCLTARVTSATFAKPNGGGATLVIPVSLLPQ
jgi:hypothetical protein